MQTSERSLMRTSPEANPEANAKANPRGTTWRAPSKQNPGTNSEANPKTIKSQMQTPMLLRPRVYATEGRGFSSTN